MRLRVVAVQGPNNWRRLSVLGVASDCKSDAGEESQRWHLPFSLQPAASQLTALPFLAFPWSAPAYQPPSSCRLYQSP